MCGISGIISEANRDDLPSLIRAVNNAMAHRGPDADGFFVEGTIALGHRRLSILDLSTSANQPFTDQSGRYVMVFNGEIYNFKEIREQIREYSFITTGDTEVVIAAYAKWGISFLDRLKGMFALAIWDRVEKTLFLARDRFGVKPLYYYKDGERLLFASEIRAILASGLVSRKVNREALTGYLKYQSFTAPDTIVKGILQLPAGTWMLYRNGQLEQKKYWEVSRTRSEIPEKEAPAIQAKVKDLLFHSVERRLVSDVPLGAFLSGGIDSSAVVAIMSQVDKEAVNAFTLSFEEKEYDETPWAELVAKKYNVRHTKLLLTPADFLEKLPEALNAMDTPSGDGLNTYVVSQAIKKSGITVALSGIGGDELFAGYPLFGQFASLKRWAGVFDHTLALRRMGAAFLPHGDQRSVRIRELLRMPTADISGAYPLFRQIQNLRSLEELKAPGYNDEGTLEKILNEAQPDIDRFETYSQVSIADYLGYTQSVLLKDTDQMSMASSLEIREPFFDHDLVEYVLNVPDHFKAPTSPTQPKRLLVESLGDLLPPEIVQRRKQGFVMPFDLWMKNELKDFCEQRIYRLAARGYFSEEILVDFWKRYLSGKSKIRWMDIWIFIVLEYWLEKNEME